jgi:hypothetical protein
MKAVFRTAKLSTFGNIGGLNSHCERTMDVPNASKEHEVYNKRLVGSSNMVQDVKNRLSEMGITQIRKNGVLAFEVLLSASSEFWNMKHKSDGKISVSDVESHKKWIKQSKDWLDKEFGKNVVNVHLHMDEKTPHIHALIVPIDAKGKLNCRDFLGGREKLAKMQDRYAESIADLGIERGISGSKATHMDLKTFYSELTPKIEELQIKCDDLGQKAQDVDGELQYLQELHRREYEANNGKAEKELKAIKTELEGILKAKNDIFKKVNAESLMEKYTNMKVSIPVPDIKPNMLGMISKEDYNKATKTMIDAIHNSFKEMGNMIYKDLKVLSNNINAQIDNMNRVENAKIQVPQIEKIKVQDFIKKPIQKKGFEM